MCFRWARLGSCLSISLWRSVCRGLSRILKPPTCTVRVSTMTLPCQSWRSFSAASATIRATPSPPRCTDLKLFASCSVPAVNPPLGNLDLSPTILNWKGLWNSTCCKDPNSSPAGIWVLKLFSSIRRVVSCVSEAPGAVSCASLNCSWSSSTRASEGRWGWVKSSERVLGLGYWKPRLVSQVAWLSALASFSACASSTTHTVCDTKSWLKV
mmetsp:Transcript_4985/g.10899  ORF Transcript_4985/g.10899 Transcript_4985/m.10899 type:complete len:211 (+) Transcript_4985:1302-1934(+)